MLSSLSSIYHLSSAFFFISFVNFNLNSFLYTFWITWIGLFVIIHTETERWWYEVALHQPTKNGPRSCMQIQFIFFREYPRIKNTCEAKRMPNYSFLNNALLRKKIIPIRCTAGVWRVIKAPARLLWSDLGFWTLQNFGKISLVENMDENHDWLVTRDIPHRCK